MCLSNVARWLDSVPLLEPYEQTVGGGMDPRSGCIGFIGLCWVGHTVD